MENYLWQDEPFTRGQAWVDLLMLANHKDGYIRIRGNKIPVKRGQVGWSVARLAERWKWSRWKVQHFLDELQDEQQIQQQKNNVSSLITLVNYEKYQETPTAEPTADQQQTDTNKNEKNTSPTEKSVAPTVWDLGVGMGIDRSIIGRQIKTAGEPKVAETLAHMALKKPADPTQYLIAATTPKKRRTAV